MKLTTEKLKALIKEELEKLHEEEEEEEHPLIDQTLDSFLENTEIIADEMKEQFKEEIYYYLVTMVTEIKKN
jgi:hypothetical protein